MSKSSKDYLREANAVVPRLSAAEAVEKHGNDNAVFVDVRDTSAVKETGTIAGALRIPRGLLEFKADAESPAHDKAMQKDADIYLVCAAGGQAALAGKTLKEMGYESVTNIGGIGDWKEAGGPVDA